MLVQLKAKLKESYEDSIRYLKQRQYLEALFFICIQKTFGIYK